jgi:hypothetical protein
VYVAVHQPGYYAPSLDIMLQYVERNRELGCLRSDPYDGLTGHEEVSQALRLGCVQVGVLKQMDH